MSDHGSRSHATWSASATARNWACPGALTLAEKVAAVDRESEAAAWGTACHQIAEKCLRGEFPAVDLLDTIEKTKEHEFVVDDELAETAQVYIDYIRGRQAEYTKAETGVAMLSVECRFDLSAINPPFDAGGTGDAVLWFPLWGLLEIVDLKGGRGVVVEAKGNPQMRTYALGAMLMSPKLPVEKVRTTIVQPRASHKDGRIRSEEFHVADLIEWSSDLLAAMRRSATAQADYATTPTGQWAAQYLKPGDHCRFCPAAAICPALEQRAIDEAGVWFDDTDTPRISNGPDLLSPEELARKLDTVDVIEEYIKALRAFAHTQAELGIQIPGYQLVEKIGNRAWKGEEGDIRKSLLALGLKPFELENVKLKSPAQIEKALGARRKDAISDLVERPIRGTNLVAAAKTSRPPADTITRFFEAN